MASIVSFVAVLVACEEPKDIGLPPTTAIGVLYTDTLTVETSTIQLDSVVTDRNILLFAGQYNDPVFGKTSARTFAKLEMSSGTFKTEGEMTYDSMRVGLGYGYVYGDTNSVQDLYIHRLTEDLDSTKVYTSTSSAAYATQPLGKIQIKPSALGELKTAHLPDALGRELLDLSKGAGITQIEFEKIFKGIAIVPGTANTTVFGFNNNPNNMYFELFYHSTTDTTKKYSIGFFVSRAKPSFSQIKTDRAGTKMAGLSLTKPLTGAATGGEMFVQSATGVTTKLRFPTIENLKKEGARIAINRAELQFFVKGSSPGGPVPSVMTLAQTDDKNRILYTSEAGTGTQLLHLIQTKEGTFQTANKWYYPQIVGYNSRQKNYAFDLTTYVQALLVGAQPNNSLVLFPISTSTLVQANNTTGAPTFLAQPYIYNQLHGAVLSGPVNAKLVVFYTHTP